MNSAMKAWIFMAGLSILALVLGQWWAGREGLFWGLFLALSVNSLLYFYGDQRILRCFQGRDLEGRDPWGLIEAVRDTANKARLPHPRLVVLENPSPQALTIGSHKKRATLVITSGLLESFTSEELKAVVAYQLASLSRLDTLAHSIGSALGGSLLLVTHFFDWLLRLLIGSKTRGVQSHLFTYLFSPLAALLVRLPVSQNSYFATDALAASWLENPKVLAQTLWKLDSFSQTRPIKAPASMGHLFIVNPLTDNNWTRYFRIQPRVEQRIRRLIGHYPI